MEGPPAASFGVDAVMVVVVTIGSSPLSSSSFGIVVNAVASSDKCVVSVYSVGCCVVMVVVVVFGKVIVFGVVVFDVLVAFVATVTKNVAASVLEKNVDVPKILVNFLGSNKQIDSRKPCVITHEIGQSDESHGFFTLQSHPGTVLGQAPNSPGAGIVSL
jgi:hypothetical protein